MIKFQHHVSTLKAHAATTLVQDDSWRTYELEMKIDGELRKYCSVVAGTRARKVLDAVTINNVDLVWLLWDPDLAISTLKHCIMTENVAVLRSLMARCIVDRNETLLSVSDRLVSRAEIWGVMLAASVISQRRDIFDMVIELDDISTAMDKATSLSYASSYGCVDELRILLDKSLGAMGLSRLLTEAAFRAAGKGHYEAFRVLVDGGADLSATVRCHDNTYDT